MGGGSHITIEIQTASKLIKESKELISLILILFDFFIGNIPMGVEGLTYNHKNTNSFKINQMLK